VGDRYLELAVVGVRSATVAEKAALHLGRFVEFFEGSYGHDRITAVVRRDVRAWQQSLVDRGLAPSTVNNHLASLSAFTTWVDAQSPELFSAGDPAKGVREVRLPPLEPRALSEAQVRSLKSVCDRLERFHELKGRE
jgi:site-specific recombinase XerD